MTRPERWLRAALCGVLLLLACGSFAQGAGETYSVEELDAEITMPWGAYYVFTPGMDPESPKLNAWGLTTEQVEAMNRDMEADNIYLLTQYHDNSFNFVVQQIFDENMEILFDFQLLSEVQKEWMIGQWKKRDGSAEVSWYETPEASYLVIETRDEENNFACGCYTVHNGKLICIAGATTVLSVDRERDQERVKTSLTGLLEGIHFTHTELPSQNILQSLSAWDERLERECFLRRVKPYAVGLFLTAVAVVLLWLRSKRRRKRENVMASGDGQEASGGKSPLDPAEGDSTVEAEE